MTSADVIARIEGSVDNGGWRCSGIVFNDADALDWYKEFESWFDMHIGYWESLPRPAFKGHMIPDPWRKTFQSSEAPFGGFTAQEMLKRGELQGIFFKDSDTPANAHQITNMTLASIVKHILGNVGEYGHCNFVKGVWPEGIIDLNINTANSTTVDEYEVKQGNFWARLKEIAAIEFYILYMDKYNKAHYVPHPMFDTALPDPVFTLTSDWLLEPLTIETRNNEQIGQVRLSGATPAGLQISGKYPTDATAGPVMQRVGYISDSNSLMTAIATRMYKFENRTHMVTASLSGAVGLLIDLMDRIAITYTSASDGITWSSKKFWINRIEVELLRNFTARTSLVLDAENA